MKSKKYLIYFCKGIESVFDSQVLELIIYLSEINVFKKVYLFLGIRNKLEFDEFQKRKLPEKIGIIIFKAYPNYPFFNFLSRKAMIKELKGIDLEECLFHVRSELIAWHLSKILNKRFSSNILPDVRGACLEEVIENKTISSFQKYLKIWNFKKAIKYLKSLKKLPLFLNL